MDWDQQSKFNEDEEDDSKMKGFDVEISVYNEPKNDKKVRVTLVEEYIAEVVLKMVFYKENFRGSVSHVTKENSEIDRIKVNVLWQENSL